MASSWLNEPWGTYTRASRQHVLLLLGGYLISQSITIFLLSDGFVAQFDDNLQTRLVQMALAMMVVFAGVSVYVASVGTPSLIAFARANGGQIVFLAVCTFGAIGCTQAATIVMSASPWSLTMLAQPLLMPFTAVCFEREHHPSVRTLEPFRLETHVSLLSKV